MLRGTLASEHFHAWLEQLVCVPEGADGQVQCPGHPESMYRGQETPRVPTL